MRKWLLLLALLVALAISGCGRAVKPLTPPAPSPSPLPQEPTAMATPAQQATSPLPSPAPTPVTGTAQAQTTRVTILYDNNGFDDRLQTEWGFGCWVEYGDHTVLFDTGGDGQVLLANMAKLGLDPTQIEMVVLSHEHGDHTLGLDGLLAVHSDLTVAMPRSFPAGLKRQVKDAGARLLEVNGPTELLPGLHSTGEMGRNIVEQALVAKSTEGLVVITGCAHPGIVQMVEQAQAVGQDDVHLVLGGFHKANSSVGAIRSIVAAFRRVGVGKAGPTHCSGDRTREVFAEAYGSDYFPAGAGGSLSIGG